MFCYQRSTLSHFSWKPWRHDKLSVSLSLRGENSSVVKGMANKAELWYFYCFYHGQTVKKTVEWPVIGDDLTLMWRPGNAEEIISNIVAGLGKCCNGFLSKRRDAICAYAKIILLIYKQVLSTMAVGVALAQPPQLRGVLCQGIRNNPGRILKTWWRHQMEPFSALLALCDGNSPVTGEFPSQRPVTRSFDVFFDLRMNKRLSKQSRGWWFEAPSRPLWRHCNEISRYHALPQLYKLPCLMMTSSRPKDVTQNQLWCCDLTTTMQAMGSISSPPHHLIWITIIWWIGYLRIFK